MRNFKTEGIIIKRRNYKDADRILTVLTKSHGKIYVRAAGVRKITSRRAGHIELLNHSLLTLYRGQAFPILTEATTINNFAKVKSDLNNIGLAYHLCELVDGLCPENQENHRVFNLLQKTLERLSQVVILNGVKNPQDPSAMPQDDTRLAINEFEMQLLSLLGYWDRAKFATVPDTNSFIESILERRLKSRSMFAKF